MFFIPQKVSNNIILIKKYPLGYKILKLVCFILKRVYFHEMKRQSHDLIARAVRERRRQAGLTQAAFALKAGLGLRFVRDLEQGKPSVRLDKVNQALGMFGLRAGPVPVERLHE